MSAAEAWYCNKNFEGIDEDGKPKKFVGGDVVPNVENWPTFHSLRNINWIVSRPMPLTKPEGVKKAKVTKPAKTPLKVVEGTDPKLAEGEKNVVQTTGLEQFSCEVCNKGFKNTRALNTHKRSHK